jgi:hypothetical protein
MSVLAIIEFQTFIASLGSYFCGQIDIICIKLLNLDIAKSIEDLITKNPHLKGIIDSKFDHEKIAFRFKYISDPQTIKILSSHYPLNENSYYSNLADVNFNIFEDIEHHHKLKEVELISKYLSTAELSDFRIVEFKQMMPSLYYRYFRSYLDRIYQYNILKTYKIQQIYKNIIAEYLIGVKIKVIMEIDGEVGTFFFSNYPIPGYEIMTNRSPDYETKGIIIRNLERVQKFIQEHDPVYFGN